jgi:hypothetical protein
MNKLKEGDVLLTSEKSIPSKTVRGLTISEFSHAILYVGHGSYIHSDLKGVHSANIQRLLFDKPSRVKVLRPNVPSAAATASMYARAQIGKGYSIKEAVRTKIGSKRKKENKQFCSRLVAESYEFAGVKVVNNPSYCSPKDINQSIFFEEITGVSRLATEDEINFAKSFNPIQRQMEITNRILSEARLITKSNIQTLEELTLYVVSNPSCADSIVDVYQKSGYLTMWQYEMEQNPWRYNGGLFMALPISQEEKVNLAKFEADSAKKQLELYAYNYAAYEQLGKNAWTSYISMNLSLYENIINQITARLEASEYVIKNAEQWATAWH